MTPAQFWQIEMQNQQNQQEQQQQQQENILQGLNDIAGVYMEQENMKSSVKAGDQLLKVLGPGIGMTEDMLKQMDYGKMPMREKYAFQQGILSNYAVAAQTRNFGQSLGVRQAGQQLDRDRPFIDASLKNLGNTAAGRGTYGTPRGETAVEPDLPVGGDFLPPVRYGAGMQNNVTRFAPSQQSVSTARNWSAGYFGKSNP
jgi:hypothetical protein